MPFGSTTKMDGCAAIYPAIAAIFVAQFVGIQLSIVQYVLIAVVSIVDMGRTAVNVAGQALVPTIVAKREGILDQAIYDAPRGDGPFDDDSDDEVMPVDADASLALGADPDERREPVPTR